MGSKITTLTDSYQTSHAALYYPKQTMSKEQKQTIQNMVIETINSMGSHFFHRTATFNTPEEAEYAKSLWHNSKRDNTTVHFYP